MKIKYFLLLLFYYILSITLNAQVSETTNYPFRKGILETSITGFPLDKFVDISTGLKYNFYENSLHFTLLTNVSKYWFIGMNYNYLWTRFKQQTIDRYFLTGLNVRYDRPIKNAWRVYGDVVADVGNYCPCIKDVRFENIPYKIDNSFYYGLGFGVAFKIYKPIWVNLAINSYALIGKKYDSYGYVQPIVGIQIHAF